VRPVLIQIGPLAVRSYTLLLGLGLLLALGILYRRASQRRAKPFLWLDGALVALALGILGGRIGYVVAHWAYYQDRQGQILKYWLGGLSWHGALVGALLGLAIYCRARRVPFWRLADELALGAPLVGAAAWTGCLLAGCGYGRELAEAHWLAADLPDLFGVWALRYNVQLLAAGWSLAVAGVLWAIRDPPPAGARAGLFMLLFGLGMALVDPLRADAVPQWGAWRLDVLLDWTLAAAGGLVTGITFWRGGGS
jgi:phosphatidylglycerol:prolipoprotein diacylglycerol transferase